MRIHWFKSTKLYNVSLVNVQCTVLGKHSCTVLFKRLLNCFPVCVQLKAKHKHGTTYDLMANIVHDGSPEKGSYKVSHPLSPCMRYIIILTLILYPSCCFLSLTSVIIEICELRFVIVILQDNSVSCIYIDLFLWWASLLSHFRDALYSYMLAIW